MVDRITYFEDGKWRMNLPNGVQWSGETVDRIAKLENDAEQREKGCEYCIESKEGSFADKRLYNLKHCPECGKKLGE